MTLEVGGVKSEVDSFSFRLTRIRKGRSAFDVGCGIDFSSEAVMDELGVGIQLRVCGVPANHIEAFRMGARKKTECLVVFQILKVHLEHLLLALALA